MRSLKLGGLASFLALALALSSCSGSGGGEGSGPFFIETCSLGCSNGQGGTQVSCAIVNIGRNAEITVLFSRPVDLSSVNSGTFRIINTANGSVPVGVYSLDPLEPRRLIFRPALTVDAVGNPIFALAHDATYQLTIPGTAQGDPGPFVRSIAGAPNQSRLNCTVRTTLGILDPVPGAPTAHASIVVRDVATNEVLEVFDPAHGATNVPTGGPGSTKHSVIRVVFNDIMNLATLANLSTGQSSNITVKIDPDGNLIDPSDQVDMAGSFTAAWDFDNLRTILEFTPAGGFPSGGSGDLMRLIVMTLPPNLLDLVGNQLTNPGQIVFRTEELEFAPILLPVADPSIPGDEPGEGFQNQSNLDVIRSGARWGEGRLTYGQGGASGRMGEIVIGAGEELVLDTDEQTFPYVGQVRSLLDNAIPGVDYDPLDQGSWPTLTVTGGAFELARIQISAGGRLVVQGSNPGRLFARGLFNVSGRIVASGEDALDHRSNSGTSNPGGTGPGLATAFGGTGGAGGPNAGRGGDGADRFDHSGNPAVGCNTTTTMLGVGGVSIPNTPNNPGSDNNGRPGGGIGLSSIGSGQGGVFFPTEPPRRLQPSGAPPPDTQFCFGDSAFVVVDGNCRVGMVAGSGSGGGYAVTGGQGVALSPFEGMPTVPPLAMLSPGPTLGGDITALGLEPPDVAHFVRRLDFHHGNLRGGSGGGGGGMSVFATRFANADCTTGSVFPYFDHSAAAGGGGGGALQLTSGTQLVVGGSGVVDSSGGRGGGALIPNATVDSCANEATNTNCGNFAAPGGGGSGGAVRMQAPAIQLAALPGRVTVEGGLGGIGIGGSVGGTGSPGLVRIELPSVNEEDPVQIAQLANFFAGSVSPFNPGGSTEPGGFNYPHTSGIFLSIGNWDFQRQRPDSMSASMSCWMKPEGNFFELQFIDDDGADPMNPDAMGWNMDVIYATPSGEMLFPYRGIPDDMTFPLTGTDFENFLGQEINSELPAGQGALIAVRFQGARATGTLTNPCDVRLSGLGAEIESGSLTPWVRHPAELNLFTPQPNMIRFTVVFEEALKLQGPTQFRVRGVTNLGIGVQPN